MLPLLSQRVLLSLWAHWSDICTIEINFEGKVMLQLSCWWVGNSSLQTLGSHNLRQWKLAAANCWEFEVNIKFILRKLKLNTSLNYSLFRSRFNAVILFFVEFWVCLIEAEYVYCSTFCHVQTILLKFVAKNEFFYSYYLTSL